MLVLSRAFYGGGAAHHPETGAVGLDVGVAGRGAVLDEGVVGRDVGGPGLAVSVEERNISRNWSPVPRSEGISPQSLGTMTSGGGAANRSTVTV